MPRPRPDTIGEATAAGAADRERAWPALPLDAWRDTQETVHLWTQVAGKVRLAIAPLTNHWWSTALYVTPRGLTTGVMYHPRGPLEIAFDFLEHRLRIETATSGEALELRPRSVADLYEEVMATLRALDRGVVLHTTPSELPDAIPFERDHTHASYDAASVGRFHRALMTADRLARVFAAGFVGKQSPSHFFWGSFDLALTRFSGRRAPEHPGGIPNIPDRVTREGYSHECASFGWWPGNGMFGRAAFYAYAYPPPDGFDQSADLPTGAFYTPELGEYLFPWEAARAAPDPDAAVLRFFQAVYERAADAGGWDRAALERDPTTLERDIHRHSRAEP